MKGKVKSAIPCLLTAAVSIVPVFSLRPCCSVHSRCTLARLILIPLRTVPISAYAKINFSLPW